MITGAGSGMGRAFALGLAREGASIGVLDVNRDAAVTVRGRDRRRRSRVSRGLVGRREQTRAEVAQALDTFIGRFGALDVLVQQRRVQPADAPDRRHRGELAFDHGCQRARLPHRHPRRREADDPATQGKIVNTSSIAGRQGYPSFAPYCASKFAVNALTQAAARAFAEYNITCNAFAPGVVDTPLWTKLDADLLDIGDAERPGQAMAEFSAGILRGRAATRKRWSGRRCSSRQPTPTTSPARSSWPTVEWCLSDEPCRHPVRSDPD